MKCLSRTVSWRRLTSKYSLSRWRSAERYLADTFGPALWACRARPRLPAIQGVVSQPAPRESIGVSVIGWRAKKTAVRRPLVILPELARSQAIYLPVAGLRTAHDRAYPCSTTSPPRLSANASTLRRRGSIGPASPARPLLSCCPSCSIACSARACCSVATGARRR